MICPCCSCCGWCFSCGSNLNQLQNGREPVRPILQTPFRALFPACSNSMSALLLKSLPSDAAAASSSHQGAIQQHGWSPYNVNEGSAARQRREEIHSSGD